MKFENVNIPPLLKNLKPNNNNKNPNTLHYNFLPNVMC